MAADISPELLRRVRSSFAQALASDARAAALLERLESGKGTYAEAQEYAGRAGAALASALRENVSSKGLPDGRMYYNIADRVLRPMLELDWDYVSAAAQQAQANINAANGIGIQAVRPEADADRVQGLVDEVSNAEHYDDVAPRLYDQIDNFIRHAVDETVRQNAELHEKVGLSPKVVRTAAPGCCKWCSEQAGTYDYASVRGTGNDVWRRHTNCNCVVEYEPGNGRRQNAHTKRWTEDAAPDKIEERKSIAAPDDRQGVRDVTVGDDRQGVRDMSSRGKSLTSGSGNGNLQPSKKTSELELDDIYIGRGLGAARKAYDIMDLTTGEHFDLVDGSHLEKVRVFAGKGVDTPYHNAWKYVRKHPGTKEEDWQHVKGFGDVDYYGEPRRAELHWSQCEGIGIDDIFVKEWLN